MEMMKTVRMHAFGDVDVLHYEEVERPLPQEGEVLVKVCAAGINPVDWGARSYPMPSTTGAAGANLPYTLGWDIAGIITALGTGVTRFALGDAVYGMHAFPERRRHIVSILLLLPQIWHTSQNDSLISKPLPSLWLR